MLKIYTPDDRDEAINLFMGVFTVKPFSYEWLKRKDVERYFADMENTPAALSFLYYENKGLPLTGLCFGVENTYFRAKLYEIKELAIRQNVQGTGLGSQMMDEIAGYLSNQGLSAIKLMTQRNIAAYGFYVKNEFVPSDTAVTLFREI